MGCICSKPHIEITLPARKITNLPDLHYSSGFFIQRNYSSFHSIYTLLPDPLGIGPYGEVRQCKHILTDALRAVKILNKLALPKNVIHQGGIINQIKILKSLDHPNIMRVFEFFEDDAAYYLVEEYYPGNDLHKAIMKIKKYDEKHACEIMKQIFSAVSYLHSKKVAHRDLKPENIIIDDEDCNYIGVKVIDFDSASFFKDNEPLKGFYGTTYYMAPEVISGEYTEKCDIWSCGVILYILLSGRAPFNGLSELSILKKVQKGIYSLDGDLWENVSDSAKDLIRKLLNKDVKKRISAHEAYNHPWIQNIKHEARIYSDFTLPKILRRMKSFHATPKLKEAVQSFIISQLINREELKKFETAFIEIDTEGDGIISKDELYQQLKKYMSDEEAKTEAEIIISHSDPNHPGYIEYSEFIRAVSDKSVIFSEENLKNTFSLLDIDHNGKISSSELEHLISGENRLDEQLLENLFDQMDPLHKGEISLIDFEESIIHRLQSRKFSTSE